MLRGESDLTQPGSRRMCLALGLLFLHRQGAVDATLEVRAALWPIQHACAAPSTPCACSMHAARIYVLFLTLTPGLG